MLDLIDHDDATQALESRHGLRQECATSGVLQVKVVVGAVWDDLSCQSGFSALAWSDQCDYPTSPEGTSYALQQSTTVEHALQTTMKYRRRVLEFHGKSLPIARGIGLARGDTFLRRSHARSQLTQARGVTPPYPVPGGVRANYVDGRLRFVRQEKAGRPARAWKIQLPADVPSFQ